MNQVKLNELQVRELARCYYDPLYYIENYCWIELKEESKILPAVLYPYQKTILNWLINRENGLVLKSRRVGGSTIVALYLSWLVNFRRGVNALLISINEEKSKKLLSKVRFSLLNLRKHTSDSFALAEDASWMLNTLAVNNQQLLAIGWQDDQGNIVSTSEIASLTTTSESGRGDSATFVFIDEMAFLQDQEAVTRSARLTTTRGGHWLAISTPNGVGDEFHSLCMRAERGENESYNYLRVHWTEAGMTERMIGSATEGMSDASRLQEMELEFLSSGDPVFNHTHLAACYKPIDEYPEVEQDIENYRELVARSKNDEYIYYTGVDSAVGKLAKKDSKRDYHSLTALTKNGVQAFTYHSKNMSLTEWAGNVEQISTGSIKREGKVSQLHKLYPGIMNVEINGPGMTVFVNHQLPDDGYSQVVPKQTNMKTKDQLIRQLVLAIEAHAIIITDKFTYQCLSVFQRGNIPGTYSAPQGDYYDDPVIALALAWDALLANGGLDFTWGQDTDNLKRIDVSEDTLRQSELATLNYGPAIIGKVGPNDRLSDHFDGGNTYIVESDLDISRIAEPEGMEIYG